MLGPGVSRSVSAMKCCKTCRWWDADNTEVDAFGKPPESMARCLWSAPPLPSSFEGYALKLVQLDKPRDYNRA